MHTPPASEREMGGGLIRRHLDCVSTRDMVCTLDQFVAAKLKAKLLLSNHSQPYDEDGC